MSYEKEVRSGDALSVAKEFVQFARKKGLDVRLSGDQKKVEFFSRTSKEKLCSSPVSDFKSPT